jgi:hypothetical protein
MRTLETEQYIFGPDELRIFKEKHIFPNGYVLFFTQDCPDEVKNDLREMIAQNGINALVNDISVGPVTRSSLSPEHIDQTYRLPIFKKKSKSNPKGEALKVEYFTSSLVHEMRTSLRLQELLLELESELPEIIEYKNRRLHVVYKTEVPWGALINTKNNSRFSIYESTPGVSVRSVVKCEADWNNLDKEERVLLGKINKILHQLSIHLVNNGLEPWDLGLHQVILDRDFHSDVLFLTIINTEEYNFSEKFGHHWTKGLLEVGLPPILFFLNSLDEKQIKE